MESKKKHTPTYTAEFRERGVRLYREHRSDYTSDNAAYRAVASKLGCSHDTLRAWCLQAARDSGERAGLTTDRPRLAPLTVWRAYAHLDDYKGSNPASDLTALVALIRRVTGLDATLTRHSDRVRRNFQNWVLNRHSGAGEKFTEEQMDWLRMIRDHLATSFTIERDDLEMAPFDGKGGMGQMYALFGDGMEKVMTEMNEALSA